MTQTPSTEYLVTACPEHGVKCVSNRASFIAYVEAARACDGGYYWNADGSMTSMHFHDAWHRQSGHDCWRCCSEMVIDPYGILDH